jgi:hypothetical protein
MALDSITSVVSRFSRRSRSFVGVQLAGLLVTFALVGVAAGSATAAPMRNRDAASSLCSSSYVDARLSWGEKCLRVGEYCKVGDVEYHAFGFECSGSGHLTSYQRSSAPRATATPTTSPTASPNVGATVLFARRTKASGCTRAASPDRRCSPGAYYSLLTPALLCSPTFRTGSIRDVPQSEKFQVEREYGMAPSYYGRTIEIDHIVPLELGGSNDIANLFPEPGSGEASYHVKDELENKLHDLVCAGSVTLRAAQRQIAANWESSYRNVFGAAP